MSDHPFAEPGDQDRTVIRPMPGGLRAALEAAPVPAGPDIEAVAAGHGPLALAAAPLLHVLGRLRNAATAPNPATIRERTRGELRAFERRAREAGVPADQLRLAHYALCAALDDVVLNTPWGNQGRWRDEPLARELHHDDAAGRGFFEQLRTLRDQRPASLPVLELMYLCLSLGMMGPYREAADGPAQLERVRHRVFELIDAAEPALPDALAPATTGIDARFVPRRASVPVWVAAAAAVAVVAGVYVWTLIGLNAASDAVLHSALAAPPAAMPALLRPPATPPPPPPPEPPEGLAERLRAALHDVPDIQVIATPAATVLRIPARALFPQPNATLAAETPLHRIVEVLRPVRGAIRVSAYTDNAPSRTVGFPSNFALSTARARAVRAALAQKLPDPARIVAEGRADAEPISPNTTPENRERNRRVDILLPTGP